MLWACLAAAIAPLPARASLLMEISNLSDQSLGTWNMGDPDITTHIDICIYSTLDLSGGYAITAVGSNGFALSNGTQQIPYSLTWDDGGAGNLGNMAGATMTNNSKLTGQSNANTLLPACALGSPTARLNLKISKNDMTPALAGTYNGTITLTLSAN